MSGGKSLVPHRRCRKCEIWRNLNLSVVGIFILLMQSPRVSGPMELKKWPILYIPLFNHHWKPLMFIPGGNWGLWNRRVSGWIWKINSVWTLRPFHRENEGESVGAKIAGRFFSMTPHEVVQGEVWHRLTFHMHPIRFSCAWIKHKDLGCLVVP